MALHSYHSSDDRPDLIEELRRFGLLGGQTGRQDAMARAQGMAPEMPIPQIASGGGGPPPMMPMPAPAVGDPLQLFMGGDRGRGPGNQPILDRIKARGAQSGGGYDPMTGIDWNTGRGGGTWRKAIGK